jgi:hypothetical protein
MPVVSSQPGSWAPSPLGYHGTIGATAHVVLHGLASGTATVSYSNPGGVVTGVDSVTYDNYSDNGTDFVTGTSTVDNVNILTGPITYTSHLVMTGADTGHNDIDVTFSGIEKLPEKITGTAVSEYDGTTITGPPHVPEPCPQSLPRAPLTKLTARLVRRHGYREVVAHVTASIHGSGLNEAGTDTRPVIDALITIRGRTTHTNRHGNATLRLPNRLKGRVKVSESAGDTLVGAHRQLTGS